MKEKMRKLMEEKKSQFPKTSIQIAPGIQVLAPFISGDQIVFQSAISVDHQPDLKVGSAKQFIEDMQKALKLAQKLEADIGQAIFLPSLLIDLLKLLSDMMLIDQQLYDAWTDPVNRPSMSAVLARVIKPIIRCCSGMSAIERPIGEVAFEIIKALREVPVFKPMAEKLRDPEFQIWIKLLINFTSGKLAVASNESVSMGKRKERT